MDTHELPLVFFTIMAQMSVGCFVVLGVLHLIGGRKIGSEGVEKLSDPALYAIGPVMVLGLIVSVLHLGNPVNALHTVSNLGTSWLSREIFFGSAFALMGAAFAICQRMKWFTPLLRQLLAAVTAVVGLVLVFVMSMVYMLPTVPGWDTWATPVTFFATTFLLGSLAIGAALVFVLARHRRAGDDADGEAAGLIRTSLRGISVSAILLLGVEFVVLPTYSLQLTDRGGAAASAAHHLLYGGGSVMIARLALVFIGAGLLGLMLYRLTGASRLSASDAGRLAVASSERVIAYAIASAFTLVLVSELLGRLLFYSSMVRIGI